MNDMTSVSKGKLMSDLKVVVADAEDLMRMTTSQAGESVADTRARVQARMAQAKEELVQMQEAAAARAKELGQSTDTYVHQNPWTAMGIAAGVGLLVGLLAARR